MTLTADHQPHDFDPREAYPALDEVMREDWSDTKMAEYDDYESRKR
ncbi:MAG TPA: hypothetical protein VG125_21610 [Pirellulales bacterium]|nr:hypothetical protein [Pirellulales bacterium]